MHSVLKVPISAPFFVLHRNRLALIGLEHIPESFNQLRCQIAEKWAT